MRYFNLLMWLVTGIVLCLAGVSLIHYLDSISISKSGSIDWITGTAGILVAIVTLYWTFWFLFIKSASVLKGD